jgi:hypothetical protein
MYGGRHCRQLCCPRCRYTSVQIHESYVEINIIFTLTINRSGFSIYYEDLPRSLDIVSLQHIISQQTLTHMSTLQLTDPPLAERLEKRPPSHWLVDHGSSPLYPADAKAWLPDVRGYDGPTRQFMKYAGSDAIADHAKSRIVISFHTNDD